MRKIMITAISILMVAGCQVPPDIKQLQSQNKSLSQELSKANRQIDELVESERTLQKDMAELNRVINVLGTEKSSRVKESSSLRGQVRRFVQKQIDSLKDFLVAGNLLDYVGGELVKRTKVDDEELMLVDLANRVPSSGQLTGVGGHFSKKTPFRVKVLRPVDKNLVVIWESKPLTIKKTGLNRINFPISVGVEKGDLVGYYFPEEVGVSFDEGTGDTRYVSNNYKLGGTLRMSTLQGQIKRRAYSIGVYGLLN